MTPIRIEYWTLLKSRALFLIFPYKYRIGQTGRYVPASCLFSLSMSWNTHFRIYIEYSVHLWVMSKFFESATQETANLEQINCIQRVFQLVKRTKTALNENIPDSNLKLIGVMFLTDDNNVIDNFILTIT